jgi:hypothetical protein
VKEPIQFPENLPPIPSHLTGAQRDLFIRIVHEMADARVNMAGGLDSMIVSMLAMQLELFQRARLELSESSSEEARVVLRKMIAEQWTSLVEIAKECLLSEDALERVLGR